MRAWPRAISDFDRALILRPNDVEILVLRAAAWRNAGNPARALADADARAQDRAGPFRGAARARLCQPGARRAQASANNDFNRVLQLVPPGSDAARRAEAGLRGEQPVPPAAERAAASRSPEGQRQAVASVPSLM